MKFGGDSWGNADKVLTDVKKVQEDNERREREAQERREAEERSLKEKKEEEARAEQKRIEAALQKRIAKRRTLIISLIVILVVISIPVLSLRHNLVSIGTNVNYAYDESTKTLTINEHVEIRDYPTTLLLGDGLNYPPWDQNKISRLETLCRFIAPIDFTRDDVDALIISDGITRIGNDVFHFRISPS